MTPARYLAVLRTCRLPHPGLAPASAGWLRRSSAAALPSTSRTGPPSPTTTGLGESSTTTGTTKGAEDEAEERLYRSVMDPERLDRAEDQFRQREDQARRRASYQPLISARLERLRTPVRRGARPERSRVDDEPSSELAMQTSRVKELLEDPAVLPRQRYRDAIGYVGQLERTPDVDVDPSIYLTLFDYIRTSFHDRQSLAVDLFDRIRLVSDPTPPVEIWNAVLRASASGPNPSAARAMDLFLEMQTPGSGADQDINEETYAHVVRALCKTRLSARRGMTGARQHAADWYSVAWRLVRNMVVSGMTPTRAVCLNLLEGAKRVGDVGRAKGLYDLLNRLEVAAGLIDKPADFADLKALTLVLDTYASHRLPKQDPPTAALREGDPLAAGQTTESTQSPEVSVDVFSSDEFPVPLTPGALLDEVDALMAPHFARIRAEPERYKSVVGQRRLAFLHTALVSVCAVHSDVTTTKNLFDEITVNPLVGEDDPARLGKAPRMTATYLAMLQRCERTKSPEKAGSIGFEVMEEWKTTLDWQRMFERTRYIHLQQTGEMWATWMRLQAKFGGAREAYDDLMAFTKRYPPTRPADTQPHISPNVLEALSAKLRSLGDVEKAINVRRITGLYQAAWAKQSKAWAESRRQDKQKLLDTQIVDTRPNPVAQ